MSVAWTDERVERVKALWLEGKSASEVAWTVNSEFPALERVSRNAVLGKVFRAGFRAVAGVCRAEPSKPVLRRNGKGLVGRVRPPTRREKPIEVIVRAPQGNAGAKVLTFPQAGVPVTAPRGAKLLPDLRHGDCRWIVAGVGYTAMFCAQASEPARPYCPEHCAVAFQRTGSAKELARSLRRFVG